MRILVVDDDRSAREDEFVLLLPETPMCGARQFAERLRVDLTVTSFPR